MWPLSPFHRYGGPQTAIEEMEAQLVVVYTPDTKLGALLLLLRHHLGFKHWCPGKWIR